MGAFNENLRQARTDAGLTQEELAERIGVNSGKVIYTWERGNGRPDCDKIVKLCAALKISSDMLLGVSADRFDVSQNEIAKIKKYRMLDAHGKRTVDIVLDSEVERMESLLSPQKNYARLLRLPRFLEPVSAGTGSFLDTATPEEILVKNTPEAEEADYVVPVPGDSMEPEFHDGDHVLVRKQDMVDVGDIGIFVINGDAYIKQLGKGKLISLNSKYKPIPLRNDDSIFCCGRVIGVAEQ